MDLCYYRGRVSGMEQSCFCIQLMQKKKELTEYSILKLDAVYFSKLH